MRWPKGPPHLALNPPYLFFIFLCLLLFLSFLCFCNTKKTCFPPRKGHFLFIFKCLPLFLFWGSPFFNFSFSVSLFFLSFFPFFPVFLFCFLLLPCFVSFFPFLSSLLLFHEKNNIRIFNYKVFLHQYFLFFGFLSSFLFEIPFSCLCFLLILSYVFVQHHCFGFQKTS